MRRNLLSILILLATIIASTARADNYFYIDDITIAPQDMGKTIEVPVKAHFDTRVSAWYVTFTFPEGLSASTGYYYEMPDGRSYIICGRDIIFDGTPNYGWYENIANWGCNNYDYYEHSYLGDLSHIYAQMDGHFSGKYWEAGDYDEMILLKLCATQELVGEITINSQTVYSVQAGNTNVTTTDLDVYEACIRYDVDCDGMITIADMSYVYDYLLNPEGYNELFDCNRDGINDISDPTSVADLLMITDGYEPYHCCLDYGVVYASTTAVIEALDFTVIIGDLDGDGVIGIGDVTGLIDLILSGTGPYDYLIADVNQDGVVTIADVTDLIDILLNN